MAIQLGSEQCVIIEVGGQEIKSWFPPCDDEAFMDAQRRLLSGRIRMVRGGRNNVRDVSTQAREKFYDETCVRIEGVNDRDGQPLDCTAAGWQKKIPINWKVSFTSAFEEQQTLTDEDQKN
jgi:hypothetical protein